MSKSWGCNVQRGDDSEYFIVCLKVSSSTKKFSSQEKKFVTMRDDVLTALIVMFTSQSIHISSHVLHLKLRYCYMSIISQFLKIYPLPLECIGDSCLNLTGPFLISGE